MNRVKGFLISNKFIFASFALPVLIMVLAFAANGIYPIQTIFWPQNNSNTF